VTDIEQFIDSKVVVSSGSVVEYCVNTLRLTDTAARKRIERLPENIHKIKGICRDHQSILHYENKWGKEEYFEALVNVLQDNARQHYLIINALKFNGGIMLKEKLASFSASPISNTKGHKSFESILADLKGLRIIEEIDAQYQLCIYLERNGKRAKAINTVQTITISHFHEWARNIGLISYEAAKFNSAFSRYQFSMVAPSYVKSLVSKKGEKLIPAFVLADILLNRNITEVDVEFFIKKLGNISMQNQSAKFIPFLIISSHSSEVYKALKSNGIIIGNIDELFGKKYSETIFGIINLLENAGAILKTNPEQYLKLIDNIEKLAIGKTNNLKGDLFEMTVGLFHGQQCKSLDISKKILQDFKQIEIDVFAEYQDRVVFAECKGYNHPIDDDYVQTWLSEKIPVVRKWTLDQNFLKGKRIEFEIWCTGGFSEESANILFTAKQNTKKYSIEYFDLEKMLKVAKKKNINHFEKIIKEYYIKEI